MGKHVHLLLLKKHGIPTGNKWCYHVPNVVTETDDGKVTIYRDKPIKNDRKVSYNRPDVKVTDKEEKTWCNVGLRFQWIMEEKIDKYIDFAAEVRRQFMVKTVIVPVVLGALVTIPGKLSGSIEKMKIEKEIGSFQNRYIYIYIYIHICG